MRDVALIIPTGLWLRAISPCTLFFFLAVRSSAPLQLQHQVRPPHRHRRRDARCRLRGAAGRHDRCAAGGVRYQGRGARPAPLGRGASAAQHCACPAEGPARPRARRGVVGACEAPAGGGPVFTVNGVAARCWCAGPCGKDVVGLVAFAPAPTCIQAPFHRPVVHCAGVGHTNRATCHRSHSQGAIRQNRARNSASVSLMGDWKLRGIEPCFCGHAVPACPFLSEVVLLWLLPAMPRVAPRIAGCPRSATQTKSLCWRAVASQSEARMTSCCCCQAAATPSYGTNRPQPQPLRRQRRRGLVCRRPMGVWRSQWARDRVLAQALALGPCRRQAATGTITATEGCCDFLPLFAAACCALRYCLRPVTRTSSWIGFHDSDRGGLRKRRESRLRWLLSPCALGGRCIPFFGSVCWLERLGAPRSSLKVVFVSRTPAPS